MRKTRQFHPTRYDLLEERLVLSRVTIAASPPPGNTQTINPKLIVTPTRIASVTSGIRDALALIGNRIVVYRGTLAAGRMKPAQFNKTVAQQLAQLNGLLRLQAAKLPFGARELYPRLTGEAAELVDGLRNGRYPAPEVGIIGIGNNAINHVQAYVAEGFASGKFYDSTKVHWTH